MSRPFNKIATITDLHFGRNGNSPLSNKDNLEFLEWFIERAKTWGADCIGVLGDWHDSRHSVQLGTLDSSLTAMEMLNAAFDRVYFITGNHDLMYRDKRDVASTVFARHLPNIKWINEPLTVGDGKEAMTFFPWLVGDDNKALKRCESRYVFGHLECNGGFYMNSKVVMPDHIGGIEISDFEDQEFTFTGHYHFRQQRGNVIYTGNIMPFNFADDWDEDRGAMLLEWGKEPIFEAWPDQPLFRTMKLSDLVENPNKLLRPKLTARVSMDTELSFEHAQYLKEELSKEYQLRRLELIPTKSNAHTQDENLIADVVFQTVDQIVYEGLDKLELGDFRSETLREIYESLAETK